MKPIQLALWFVACAFAATDSLDAAEPQLPALQRVNLSSTLDGETQPVLYWAPESAKTETTPLFVFLHSWSSDYRQDNSKWQQVAVDNNWIYLHSDFRGENNTPAACGSRLARQDILDAMDWACRTFQVDASRVYLAGVSGGGHMSMLMAGHHPDRFSAVSAWVGIGDLAEWHRFHNRTGKLDKYGQMIEASLGGAPGTSAEIDAQYRDRSPVFHIHRAAVGDDPLPITIWAGVDDGHSGSVPVDHSLRPFNRIAEQAGALPVSESEIQQLLKDRRLLAPTPS
ncbi:MAG: prolyl oligopeptidase family serine peptidase, partial [Planctomycetaceae bacterium]|nr:prolyl oligopeptidase family serine peptidase [Planctomycetaceae bacterium]